jgi:hypothetical protein
MQWPNLKEAPALWSQGDREGGSKTWFQGGSQGGGGQADDAASRGSWGGGGQAGDVSVARVGGQVDRSRA